MPTVITPLTLRKKYAGRVAHVGQFSVKITPPSGSIVDGRQHLLGHKSQRITRHYSAPDIDRLLLAAEKVVELRQDPTLRLVRERAPHNSHTERRILATQSAVSP